MVNSLAAGMCESIARMRRRLNRDRCPASLRSAAAARKSNPEPIGGPLSDDRGIGREKGQGTPQDAPAGFLGSLLCRSHDRDG